MTPETVLSFEFDGDLLPTVKSWADGEGFRYAGVRDGFATFQKGTGFLVAPMLFAIRQDGRRIDAKAWIHCNLLARIGSLFMLPRQMGVESGGFRGTFPRKIARNAINRLLAQIGQRPID